MYVDVCLVLNEKLHLLFQNFCSEMKYPIAKRRSTVEICRPKHYQRLRDKGRDVPVGCGMSWLILWLAASCLEGVEDMNRDEDFDISSDGEDDMIRR